MFRLHAGGRTVKVHRMTAAEPTTDGSYRDRIVAVEPGGNEFIAEADRHGRPSQLLWTWASPNLEFATIFLGVLAVSYFGMTFWQAVAGIVVGAGLGAVAHFFLSARGPQLGVPQMVIGRLSFGYRGNAVPSTLMAITAGVGWFATNSISAAFALATLFGFAPVWALVLVVIVQTALAFFGHNLVQAFERWAFPVLAVIFAITAVVIMSKADLGAPAVEGGVGGVGGFLLTVGATFGYVAGWTPYAADFSRYLPSTVSPARSRSPSLPTRVRTIRPMSSPVRCPVRWPPPPCWPSRSVPWPPTPSTSTRPGWHSSPPV